MKTNNPKVYHCHLCNDDHVISTVDINRWVVDVAPYPNFERGKYFLLPSHKKHEFVTPSQYNSLTVVNSDGEQDFYGSEKK